MANNIVGIKELRQNMEKYVLRVKKGESLIIVKRSRPLFKITPLDENGWEEVIDFTKIQRGGVAINELISRL